MILLYLIKTQFLVNFWITLPIIITCIFSVIFMVVMLILLFIDNLYRPNHKQYAFNLIFDYVIPLITISTPTIIFILLNPKNIIGMQRFGYLILIHISIILPIIYFWSKHRNWFSKNNSLMLYSWNHPRLLLELTIALIYPILWGVYYYLIRFFRIGNTINYSSLTFDFLNYLYDIIFISIFLLPYTICWFYIFFSLLIKIRCIIWDKCCSLCYSLHLFLLNYTFYFYFMEKLFILNYIFYNILSLNAPLTELNKNKNHSYARKLIHYLYYKPTIILILIFIFILIELYSTKKLYYTFHLLFFYPLIWTSFNLFNTFGNTSFIKDVCMVDYLNKDLNKIRYPIAFWIFIQDTDLFYGFSLEISKNEYKIWEKAFEKNINKYKRYYKPYYLQNLLEKTASIYQTKIFSRKFIILIKVAYFKTFYAKIQNKCLN